MSIGVKFAVIGVLTVALWVVDMAVGSTDLGIGQVWAALTGTCNDPMVTKIVVNIRLVKALVAVLAGAGLSVSGLMMQTLFRNPLAGPYVLGISSGASLGVALYILAPVSAAGAALSGLGIAGAAWVGAAAVFAGIAVVARRIRDIMVVLILGMMFASATGAVVQILQYLSRDETLKAFVVWTMGSLGDVTMTQLWILAAATVAGLVLAAAAVKPLNLLLLGEGYARTMGMRTGRARSLIFASTTLLAGTVTAFCGPIGFIGLAMPHVARLYIGRADHRLLLPAAALTGAVVLLGCDIISKQFTVPINAVTALVGIPIVAWVVLRNKSITV